MTEKQWDIIMSSIAGEMYRRLKFIALYGNEYCFEPSNLELVEKWEKHMKTPIED